MKKIYSVIAGLLLTACVWAQAPQKMSYQAVIRNSSNALITSTSVGMQISVLQGTSTGTAVYVETQTPSTNANGLVSLEIGAGTIVTGTFAGINWAAGPYFIKTETDPTGGTAYTIAGTNELISVPYALYAKTSGNGSGIWTEGGDSIAYINRNVGIGTSTPVSELQVTGKITTDSMHVLDELEVGNSVIIGSGPYNRIDGDDGPVYIQSFSAPGWAPRPQNVIITADQNPNGRVGIGTTTPTVKLDVEQGTVRVNRKTADHTNPHVRVSDNDNPDDFASVTNATNVPNHFLPAFHGKSDVSGWPSTPSPGDVSNMSVLVLANDGQTLSRRAAMQFDARNYNNTGPLISKDLFSWGSWIGNGGSTHMLMDAQGNLGIGTTNPGAKLEVAGQVKITGGAPGQGKVLTSNQDGLATWEPGVAGADGALNAWSLLGNAGTVDDGTYFIGTTDNIPFNIKVGNVKAGRIDPTQYNAFYGYQSGLNISTGVDNTGIGTNALAFLTTAVNNSALGRSALQNNTTGGNNTATGKSALAANTTGGNNTAVGLNALSTNTTGFGNMAIGYTADVTSTNLSKATAIGYNAKVAVGNAMVLGGTGVDEINVGIGTTIPTVKLDVEQGTVRVNRKTADHTNPHVRVSDNDNPDDYAGLTNGTGAAGYFIPVFTGKSNVAGWLGDGDVQNAGIVINAAPDAQTNTRQAALAFDVRKYDNTGPLLNKDLFSWGSFVGSSIGGQQAYMLMDAQGNLGIGTTNPGAKLEVAGQVKITGGAPGPGKVLTSDQYGLATWEPAATGGGCSTCHFIGESYGGGVVFYVYDGGQHGLIAANNYSEVPFSPAPSNNSCGAIGDGVNAGAMNTALIVAKQMADNLTGNYAAQVCADFTATSNGVLYGDWYLPSKHELNLLFLEKANLPGLSFPFTWQYWSSTESSSTNAWNQLFDSGTQQQNSKGNTGIARAIRSF